MRQRGCHSRAWREPEQAVSCVWGGAASLSIEPLIFSPQLSQTPAIRSWWSNSAAGVKGHPFEKTGSRLLPLTPPLPAAVSLSWLMRKWSCAPPAPGLVMLACMGSWAREKNPRGRTTIIAFKHMVLVCVHGFRGHCYQRREKSGERERTRELWLEREFLEGADFFFF